MTIEEKLGVYRAIGSAITHLGTMLDADEPGGKSMTWLLRFLKISLLFERPILRIPCSQSNQRLAEIEKAAASIARNSGVSSEQAFSDLVYLMKRFL